MRAKSACAVRIVASGLSLPMAEAKATFAPRRPRFFGDMSRGVHCAPAGNRKFEGMTPTTVYFRASNSIDRPTMSGSPAKRLRQRPQPRTATWSLPG